MRKPERTAKKIIHVISETWDFLLLLVFLMFIILCLYSDYESDQIYERADSKQYAIYEPDAEDNLNFAKLKQTNPDTWGWLKVYGTKINYPVMQARDNHKYINTDPLGEFSLSGALFADFRNHRNVMDFNTIIYGHHMEKHKLFGSLDDFKQKQFFARHKYGTYNFQDRNYGVEFYALLKADAYDQRLYQPAIAAPAKQTDYLAYIKQHALRYREVGVDAHSKLLVLSTCASAMTNGRIVLVGKITDRVHADPFAKQQGKAAGWLDRLRAFLMNLPLWVWPLLLLLLGLLIVLLVLLIRHVRHSYDNGKSS